MQIQKLKLGQQNTNEGSIYLAGTNKKATLKCKKIIIKTLEKLYESVYCCSTNPSLSIVYFFLLTQRQRSDLQTWKLGLHSG